MVYDLDNIENKKRKLRNTKMSSSVWFHLVNRSGTANYMPWEHLFMNSKNVIIYGQPLDFNSQPKCTYYRNVDTVEEVIQKIKKYKCMHFNVVVYLDYKLENVDSIASALPPPQFVHIIPNHNGGIKVFDKRVSISFVSKVWKEFYRYAPGNHEGYRSNVVTPWFDINACNIYSSIKPLTYPRTFLYFYSYGDEDGLEIFLEVARRSHKFQFWIIGMSTQPHWPKNVIGHFEKKRLIHSASAVIIPSLVFEPYNMTVMESLYSGTPVIAPQLGCYQDDISHSTTGFLIPVVVDDINESLELYFSHDTKEKFIKNIISYMKEIDKLSPKACTSAILERPQRQVLATSFMKFAYGCIEAAWMDW